VTNAEVSDDDLAGLDEFGLLHENAEQIGAVGSLPSVQRIESGPVSAIRRHRADAARGLHRGLSRRAE
jgi:hypothetical protein